MRRVLAGRAAVFVMAGAAMAQDNTAPATSITKDGIVTVDSWNARYCELLVVKGSLLKLEADVYNTLGLNTCDAAAWQAIDTDAVKKQMDAREAFKNGPRYWVVSSLSTPVAARAAPVETFGGLEARLVGVLQLAPGMRKGPNPYEETTVQRDTRYGYPSGRPVFILDDPDGQPWVMQAYSQIVDPALTLDDLAGLGTRLKLPTGWTFRTKVLDSDLTVQPVDGTARILQDELENTYDLCFASACSYLP